MKAARGAVQHARAQMLPSLHMELEAELCDRGDQRGFGRWRIDWCAPAFESVDGGEDGDEGAGADADADADMDDLE